MQTPLNPTWNLENIFPGGSESTEFHTYLLTLKADIENLTPLLKKLTVKSPVSVWDDILDQLQTTAAKLRQAGAFTSCLMAQNTQDNQAKLLSGQVRQISANFSALLTQFDAKLLDFDSDQWQALINQPQLEELQFILNERRQRAQARLPAEQETLANDLAVDGYHAWNELYNTVVGRINLDVEIDNTTKTVSVGQANNLLAHPNREVRKATFAKYEQTWAENADLFSTALNHLSGFRLNLYRNRGWDNVLQEPLEINRMSQDTLDTMWETISRNKGKVVEFINRKAQLLGLEQLAWYDVSAPLNTSEESVSYDQAAKFIVEQFNQFDPQMADFSVQAFEKRWIEAEDRAGKRPGGFCTSFPLSNESRIFMTYSGSATNVSTLAHELGHAYHQSVMTGLSQFNTNYAMNVAETASTFAEMIVADAAIKTATSKKQLLSLLEDKIQRSVAFFMDIHARFIFETNFYQARQAGPLSINELNQLMVNAQKEAFQDSLSEWHPHFWASKLHFYITGVPFYNFPYTFGYLFSTGIYAKALAEGASFAPKYRELLRDTGRMEVEELAAKHLAADLRQPDFWQAAIDMITKDIDQFLQLTE